MLKRMRRPAFLPVAILLLVSLAIPMGWVLASGDTSSSILLPFVTGGSSANLDGTALGLISDRYSVAKDQLSILSSARAEYPYSKQVSQDYKIYNAVTGDVYGISLYPNGQEANAADLLAADAAAYTARYGKFDPDLYDLLTVADPDLVVPVIIALNEPQGVAAQRIDPAAALTESEVATFKTNSYVAVQAAVDTVVSPVVAQLQDMGITATPIGLIPYVSAQPYARDLLAIANLPEVRAIGLDLSNESQLDFIWSRVRYNSVFPRRIIGRTKLAVNEVGHGIDAGNPYLSYVFNDAYFRCTTASGHETGVLGIIYSSHLTYSGLAMGSTLWTGGSCSGSSGELKSRATASITWGANAVNNSWGSTYAGTTRSRSSAYEGAWDDIVRNTWTTIVFAVGNMGNDPAPKTGWITRPSGAYTVISVGAEDKTTPATMASYSSYIDPDTLHDDMEKPEVTAPGSNINSTTTTSPWVGGIGSGTSFAAPVVTALSGTTIQRASWLASWPEAQKALIMVSALRDIEPGKDRDGQGGVDFVYADDAARGYYGLSSGTGYACSTANPLTLRSVSVPAGKRIRFAIVWDVPSTYASYAQRPSADVDLYVYNSAGALVAASSSWDNSYELVDYTPTTTGTYTFKAYKIDCYADPGYLGWAYWRQP